MTRFLSWKGEFHFSSRVVAGRVAVPQAGKSWLSPEAWNRHSEAGKNQTGSMWGQSEHIHKLQEDLWILMEGETCACVTELHASPWDPCSKRSGNTLSPGGVLGPLKSKDEAEATGTLPEHPPQTSQNHSGGGSLPSGRNPVACFVDISKRGRSVGQVVDTRCGGFWQGWVVLALREESQAYVVSEGGSERGISTAHPVMDGVQFSFFV